MLLKFYQPPFSGWLISLLNNPFEMKSDTEKLKGNCPGFVHLQSVQCLTLWGVMGYNLWEILWYFIGICHKMPLYPLVSLFKIDSRASRKTQKEYKWEEKFSPF